MDDSVSAFIVGTCRMSAMSMNSVCKCMHCPKSQERKAHLIVCGSCAEFFIQPLLSCFGDVDYLIWPDDVLVFTNETPVLPYACRHIAKPVMCVLIEPCLEYPAFVRLRILGEMRYDWGRKAFEFVSDNAREIQVTPNIDENDTYTEDKSWINVGPAQRSRLLKLGSESVDFVKSAWCPQWPNEARNWPFRRRKYGWPTTAIIHEVIQNGCHVVYAKHPACRNDIHQWRLSFSVAEVILLQSWTPVQQIVYHMLRFLAKKELIKKRCPKEDEALCTYHIKTLMLWSCEERSSEWWHSSSVIQLCCNLFKELEKWMQDTRCRNYFIPQANLFHENINPKMIDETSKKLIHYSNSDILSLWFVEHYMQPRFLDALDANCSHDVLSCEYMFQTLEAMKTRYPKFIDFYFASRLWVVGVFIKSSEVQIKCECGILDILNYCLRFISPMGDKFDLLPADQYESCFSFYGSMLHILYAAYLSSCKEVDYGSDVFLEKIRLVLTKPIRFRSKHHIVPRPLNTGVQETQSYLIEAQDLMENMIGSNNDLEFQVVCELSKRLLTNALLYDNYKRNATVALAYMAALHFVTSEYQITIDLCSRVIMNEKPDKEDTETLNAGCLLFIEEIAIIVGFYLTLMKTKDASLQYTRKQFFVDLRLTPEVFVHYLTISLIERADLTKSAGALGQDIPQTPSYPLDAILISITNLKSSLKPKETKNVLCVYQRIDSVHTLAQSKTHSPNSDKMFRLLMECSLRNMTSFYKAICEAFDIDCIGIVGCYHAAYLYQCHKYPEVLNLCERILNEPDIRTDLKELAFANVTVLPPLDSYFDRDIQCLLGLHTIVSNLSPSNEDLEEIESSDMSTLQNEFARIVYSYRSWLSTVLVKQYSKKCHYFLGKHFLARYLKVRCLIDCNYSFSVVYLEFKKLRACLPFEQLIRCFIEHKLRKLQNFC